MRRTLLLVILLAGCQRKSGSESAADAPPVVDLPPPDAAPSAEPATPASSRPGAPPFEGTAGVTEKKHALKKTAVQGDVRAARHEGYDRVVFEFEAGAMPGYHVEYVDRPVHRCGSGQVVEVAGDGWLRIRFELAAAHDESGKATIAEADRQKRVQLGVLREQVLTCDFEGQVVWVLGVASPNRYRVLELDKPSRLVVDIRHR